MAEDAKNPPANQAADEKGQANQTTDQPVPPTVTETTAISEDKKTKTSKKSKRATAKATSKTVTGGTTEADPNSADAPQSKTTKAKTPTTDADFQATIREQIENCKFEIVAALQESVHTELKHVMHNQIRKVERRRIFGTLIRDILILILIVVAGFFAYRLYEYGEFSFMFPTCEQTNTCNFETEISEIDSEPEIIKDLAWYRKNYGDLFNNLQTKLDADKIDAYYLYSGDYKVNEIASEYLLSMAYNQLSNNFPYTENGLIIPATNLRAAFIDTFGNADNFVKRNFTYDCHNFTYDQANDTFNAPNVTCTPDSERQILEEITQIYEEGNVLYFLTVATIYDRTENAYYSFDNLFRPIITNVTETDLSTHLALLNRYQYQFKRTDDEHFYFSGIIKLK